MKEQCKQMLEQWLAYEDIDPQLINACDFELDNDCLLRDAQLWARRTNTPGWRIVVYAYKEAPAGFLDTLWEAAHKQEIPMFVIGEMT